MLCMQRTKFSINVLKNMAKLSTEFLEEKLSKIRLKNWRKALNISIQRDTLSMTEEIRSNWF